jgi:hypothetical protein
MRITAWVFETSLVVCGQGVNHVPTGAFLAGALLLVFLSVWLLSRDGVVSPHGFDETRHGSGLAT